MSAEERGWMYQGWNDNGCHSKEWVRNTNAFLDYAFSGVPDGESRGIVCPCSECRNGVRRSRAVMRIHLCKRGFMPGYTTWTEHGEHPVSSSTSEERHNTADGLKLGEFGDAMHTDGIKDKPTADAKAIDDMLAASKEPLHNRTRVSQITAVAHLMAVKSKHNLSGESINALLSLLGDALPENHKMPNNVDECERLLKGLKIPHGKEDQQKDKCDICGESCDFVVEHAAQGRKLTAKRRRQEKERIRKEACDSRSAKEYTQNTHNENMESVAAHTGAPPALVPHPLPPPPPPPTYGVATSPENAATFGSAVGVETPEETPSRIAYGGFDGPMNVTASDSGNRLSGRLDPTASGSGNYSPA